MKSFLSALKRFGRVAISIFIVGLIAVTKKDPKWVLFAPLISAAGKYLRSKWGLKYIPF